MRFQVACLILLLTLSCKAAEPLPKVDRIEMRLSGWSAVDVEIDSRGVGRYELSDFPKKQAGSFTLTPQQHAALLKRLEPFQREASPLTDKSIKRALEARCPEGVPSVTDAGGFWVHWVGPDYDRHYSADLGCDYQRNSSRNDDLRAILRSLPIGLTI